MLRRVLCLIALTGALGFTLTPHGISMSQQPAPRAPGGPQRRGPGGPPPRRGPGQGRAPPGPPMILSNPKDLVRKEVLLSRAEDERNGSFGGRGGRGGGGPGGGGGRGRPQRTGTKFDPYAKVGGRGGGQQRRQDPDEVQRFQQAPSAWDKDAAKAAGYAAPSAPEGKFRKKNKVKGATTNYDDKPRRGSALKERRGGGRNVGMDDDTGGRRGGRGRKKRTNYVTVTKPEVVVNLTESTITVADLAERMEAKPTEVIRYLMMDLGIMATVTQSIDTETALTVAEAFGLKTESASSVEEDDREESVSESGIAIDLDDPDSLVPRPPVVTIMGHVDHGKTSLLDALRSTKVAAGEAGGITQAMGAYQVKTEDGRDVTFVDTPGHAAFSEMRARGANTTDVVVLVVAADDGVKEQTIESIATAKLAGVPVVVAINKIDKAGADPGRVLNELMKYDLLSEEFGGDTQVCQVSAKERTGLDELLGKLLLQADVLELKANPERQAQGSVVEAGMRMGLGTVATTLIQRGTLKVGDVFLAGASWGKVRKLMDFQGNTVTEAGPSMPVQVVGFDGVPAAGDIFTVVDEESTARELAEARRKLSREALAVQQQGELLGSVEAILAGMAETDGKEKLELPILIKADVQGSAEALSGALAELVSEDEYFKATCKILGNSVGEVTKSDISIAGVSNAFIVAFNVAANAQAMEDARRDGLDIGYYSIVYDVIDEVQQRLDELRSPTPDGTYVGKATVLQIFNIGKVGNIAGSTVEDGVIRKGTNVRVMRMGRVVHEGKLKTLKNLKQDADEMVAGTECGIQVSDFESFETGDSIECYEM